jgi:hypothetical protein
MLEVLYRRLLGTVIQLELFSGFGYTQCCDTFQEAIGLLHADRTPKLPLAAIHAASSGTRTHVVGGA